MPVANLNTPLLVLAAAAEGREAVVTHPAGVLAMLLLCLAAIFWATQRPVLGKLFKVVPALLFCYFVPTTLTTLGVLPNSSPLYSWIKAFVLPASLLLLILPLDIPAIMRLGPKAVVMLLAGTAGVVVGGPIALFVGMTLFPDQLPEDFWRGMTALCGSWIGGGANFVALGEIANASDSMMALMVVPDVIAANIWMGTLIFLAQHQNVIDRWTGADTAAIRELQAKTEAFQKRVARIASVPELVIILAFAFGASWLSYEGGNRIDALLEGQVRHVAATVAPETDLTGMSLHEMGKVIDGVGAEDAPPAPATRGVGYRLSRTIGEVLGASAWKFILVTAIGLILSFTPARNFEGAGASKIGTVFLYLLVAVIGAGADFQAIAEHPAVLGVSLMWISIHVAFMLGIGWLIRAPIFFVAVGSQANIGGAASAPVVAGAYHPSLAPVGALLAIAGYVLGTYAGIICMWLLQFVAGVG